MTPAQATIAPDVDASITSERATPQATASHANPTAHAIIPATLRATMCAVAAGTMTKATTSTAPTASKLATVASVALLVSA